MDFFLRHGTRALVGATALLSAAALAASMATGGRRVDAHVPIGLAPLRNPYASERAATEARWDRFDAAAGWNELAAARAIPAWSMSKPPRLRQEIRDVRLDPDRRLHLVPDTARIAEATAEIGRITLVIDAEPAPLPGDRRDAGAGHVYERDPAAEIVIERQAGDAGWEEIGRAAPQVAFVDAAVEPRVAYRYRARCVGAGGGLGEPGDPVEITASDIYSVRASSWGTDAITFRIERRDAPDAPPRALKIEHRAGDHIGCRAGRCALPGHVHDFLHGGIEYRPGWVVQEFDPRFRLLLDYLVCPPPAAAPCPGPEPDTHVRILPRVVLHTPDGRQTLFVGVPERDLDPSRLDRTCPLHGR